MADTKIVVMATDMSEEEQHDALDVAVRALEKHTVETDVAQYMKKEFDSKYLPNWHCIVGRNFGTCATHAKGHYIQFYIAQTCILLFKDAPLRDKYSPSAKKNHVVPTHYSYKKLAIEVRHSDMVADLQKDVIDTAIRAQEKCQLEKDIANFIKKEFDTRNKSTWHCIVGRQFGSCVTHERSHLMNLTIGNATFLLFKSIQSPSLDATLTQ
eukprot:TRINITY_DN112538_c0_g1_i1.p1 TRINITY_DN112538_c0_g1~~TRINITY_DN112538_c0_g1_i1.p1  ORF type:complete len:211 (-),score=10.00 TRINITY_DN112538_c0_g1_i1:269-901(-)